MKPIIYKTGNNLDVDKVIELYRISTLGERRPIGNRELIRAMLDNADIIVTAWDDAKLVGLARTLTDYSYVAYLADLAVHIDYQKQGIGKSLVEKTRQQLEPTCFITLLAAPDANDYYAKIGFVHHPRAWVWKP
jgi:predicted N-acetyltransferase YhbS